MRVFCFFFSSRRRHTRLVSDWSSDVCSSDLLAIWDGRSARDNRTWQAINGLAERTCSPRPVRCEWHWGERDRILPCDADALFVNRWHDQMAPYRDARLLRAASRVGAACWDGPQKS